MSSQRKTLAFGRLSISKIRFRNKFQQSRADKISFIKSFYRSEGFLFGGELEASLGVVCFPDVYSGDLLILSWQISKLKGQVILFAVTNENIFSTKKNNFNIEVL